MLKFGIIIVNYNRKDFLEKCMMAVEKIDYPDFEIILIDNGSSDGSVELVRDRFKNVEIIELDYNSGFCKANNLGIELALNNCCQAVVLLNNDTEVDKLFLEHAADSLSSENRIGMVASKILSMTNRKKIDSAGLQITPDGLGKNRGSGDSSEIFNKKEEVFAPVGAAAVYSKELLEDIRQNKQYLDEDYCMYLEELDLGWRARLKGWKCVYNPEMLVYHFKGATAGVYSEISAYYANRNIYFNIIKNYPFYYLLKAFILSFFRYILLFWGLVTKKGTGHRIRNNVGYRNALKIAIKSIANLIGKIPEMIKKRKVIQCKKITNNKEVKRWFRELGLTFFQSIYK